MKCKARSADKTAATNQYFKIAGSGGSRGNYWAKLQYFDGTDVGYVPYIGSKSDAKVGVGCFVREVTSVNASNPVVNSYVDYDISGTPYTYRNGTVSIVAGNGTSYGAGEYLSIAAISEENATVDDKVVMVWYDSTARKLYYSCNKEPLENANGKSDRSGWTTPVEVFDQSSDMAKAGEYCKVAVDSNGGVHIAAYDPINLDLVYAYLPKDKIETTSQSDFRTCIVDSNGVVGSNLTLDVGKVSNQGNVVPYIGYYATSSIRPKIAYYVDKENSTETELILGFASDAAKVADGSIDDEFTGSWECSIVPTDSTVEMQSNQHNDIGIGLWKDSGVIVDSNSPKYTTGNSATNNTMNSYDSVSNGNVYGNGTKNAVLGYAIKHGSIGDNIETAQMR